MICTRFAIAIGAAGLALATPVEAAVKVCMAPVASGIVMANSEVDAKRKAIEAWVDRVKVLGPRFTGWNIANAKSLKCARTKAGKYECIALGTPCTIEQVPPKAKPKRRMGPTGKPIEA